MSDTPRTNAATERYQVPVDFARTLERQLAVALDVIERLQRGERVTLHGDGMGFTREKSTNGGGSLWCDSCGLEHRGFSAGAPCRELGCAGTVLARNSCPNEGSV